MDLSNITLGLAFLAGLASFLSPCVFSLVPAYVGYLSGRAAGGEGDESNKFVTFTHGLAFVLGFSIIFVLLGVAASAFGGLLYDIRTWLAKIGGIVFILVTACLQICLLCGSQKRQIDPQHDDLRAASLSRDAEILTGIAFVGGVGASEERISYVGTRWWEHIDMTPIKQSPNLAFSTSNSRGRGDDLGADAFAILLNGRQFIQGGFIQPDHGA